MRPTIRSTSRCARSIGGIREDEEGEPKMEAVLAEINGWKTEPDAGRDGRRLRPRSRRRAASRPADRRLHELKDDGSTACGCWIYSGVLRQRRREQGAHAASRTDYLGHGWGFAWPGDRRILYNRASAEPDGAPWSEAEEARLVGRRRRSNGPATTCPIFQKTKRPDYQPNGHEKGLDALPGDAPFILHEDGLGWLYVPEGFAGRPDADALRAARVAGAKRALRARHQPAGELVHARRKIASRRRAIRVSRSSSRLIASPSITPPAA